MTFYGTGSENGKWAAVRALNQAPLKSDADYERLFSSFGIALNPDPGETVRSAILATTVAIFRVAQPRFSLHFKEIIQASIQPGGKTIHFWVASTLSSNLGHLPADIVDWFLAVLKDVDPKHKGTIDYLDMALGNLVRSGQSIRVQNYLEQLFSTDPKGEKFNLEVFDSVRDSLLANNVEPLGGWVISWLRTGDFNLCSQLEENLFGAGTDTIFLRVDCANFGLSDAEYRYIARKAVGFFFYKPAVSISILTSLLWSAPPETAEKIEELLFDPIAINLPGGAQKYLEPIANDPSDAAAETAKRVLLKLEKYMEDLKTVPIIRELHPKERQIQAAQQHQSDAVNNAYRGARDKSVFANLFKNITFFYGKRTVLYIDPPSGEPRRMESELSNISHSVEVPRMHILDPCDLTYRLLTYRHEPRSS